MNCEAVFVIGLAGGGSPVVGSPLATLAALIGAAVVGAAGAWFAARIQARSGYKAVLDQTNREARRDAYVEFHAASLLFLNNLKRFSQLNSRAVSVENLADCCDKVIASAGKIQILGPPDVWSRTKTVKNMINVIAFKIAQECDIYYGWRELCIAQRQEAKSDVACAAKTAVITTFQAQSDGAIEAAFAAADGPLRAAQMAGIITRDQRKLLHAASSDVVDRVRMEGKLDKPRQEVEILLEEFTESASSYLENTELPGNRKALFYLRRG